MAGTLHNWGAGQRVGGAQSPGHIKLFFSYFSLFKKNEIYGHALAHRFLFVSISSFPKDFPTRIYCTASVLPPVGLSLFLTSCFILSKIIVLTKESSNGPADHVINRPLMITPIQLNHFLSIFNYSPLRSPQDDASQGILILILKF
jgi:hypothetical protein